MEVPMEQKKAATTVVYSAMLMARYLAAQKADYWVAPRAQNLVATTAACLVGYWGSLSGRQMVVPTVARSVVRMARYLVAMRVDY